MESLPPPTWAFGATPEQADQLLALVLSGTKTATAGALWDYEAEGEELPTPGELGIVTDGRGVPHALVMTTQVEIVPFDEVSAEHAYLEGEGDRSLAAWAEVHERLFTEHAAHHHGFSRDIRSSYSASPSSTARPPQTRSPADDAAGGPGPAVLSGCFARAVLRCL